MDFLYGIDEWIPRRLHVGEHELENFIVRGCCSARVCSEGTIHPCTALLGTAGQVAVMV